MLAIAQQYIDNYGDEAIARFVTDLETGDPTTLKAGYSRENAIIAASDAFKVSRTAVRCCVEREDKS